MGEEHTDCEGYLEENGIRFDPPEDIPDEEPYETVIYQTAP